MQKSVWETTQEMQKASETRLKFPYQWSSLWILCLTTDCLSLLCFSVFVLYSGETVLFSCVRLSGLKPWAAINDQSSNTSCHNRPGFWPRCNRCRSNAWRSSLSSTWHCNEIFFLLFIFAESWFFVLFVITRSLFLSDHMCFSRWMR